MPPRHFARHPNVFPHAVQKKPGEWAGRYQEWRASVPWSDGEIIHVMRQQAENHPAPHVKKYWNDMAEKLKRDGRLSGKVLSSVLADLVLLCDECGKKALYHIQFKGYCKEHKRTDISRRQERLNTWAILKANSFYEFDRKITRSQNHHAARGRRGTAPRD
jgi:hypothetical protein